MCCNRNKEKTHTNRNRNPRSINLVACPEEYKKLCISVSPLMLLQLELYSPTVRGHFIYYQTNYLRKCCPWALTAYCLGCSLLSYWMYWLWSSKTVKHILECIVGLGPEVLSSLCNQGNSEPFLQTSSWGKSSDTKESHKLDIPLEVKSIFVGRGLFPAM